MLWKALSRSSSLLLSSPLPLSRMSAVYLSCTSCSCKTKGTEEAIPSLLQPEYALTLHNCSQVRFLDGSWHMNKARSGSAEFFNERISGAQYFDIDAIADQHTTLPHMLPKAEEFAQAVSKLGISSSDHVVVYTTKDSFSAARVWWMFRVFGHTNVSILQGGLGGWKSVSGPVESGPVLPVLPGKFTAELNTKLVVNADQVLSVVNTGASQILDARSNARFLGQAPEPRAGLPGGHIPGALSLPFTALVQPDDATQFRPLPEIRDAFADSGYIMGSKAVLSCGSGVTAAVLSFGLHLIGKDLEIAPVYDGSWTEWASRSDLPKYNPAEEDI